MVVYKLARTDEEIDSLINECMKEGESKYPGMERSKYPGMTYEQGIRAAIAWLTDRDEEHII